jgi:hypothetical protein
VRLVLQVLATGGSAVLVDGPLPGDDDPRLAAEGVTFRVASDAGGPG